MRDKIAQAVKVRLDEGKVEGQYGTIYPNTLHGERFTIIESWEDLAKVQELAKTLGERFAGEDEDLLDEAECEHEGAAEDALGEWGFSDEYTACTECSCVVQTSPDSYGWTADFVTSEDGDLVCSECWKDDPEWVLEIKEGREGPDSQPSLPRGFPYEDQGLSDVFGEDGQRMDYESGLHPGQTDMPGPIVEALAKEGIPVWFAFTSGQFDIRFWPVVKEEHAAKAARILAELA